MKYTEDNAYQFETDVQSYRNFIEKKLRPTLSNQRIDSIKFIPINNPKTLLKYIPIAKYLQKLL